MKQFKYMAAVVIAAMAISSCNESTDVIGNSLTEKSDLLDITHQSFNATSRTIAADSVLSESANMYIGKVRDPQTGTNVTSEFVTQFHVLEDTYVSGEEFLPKKDSEGKVVSDSCDLILYLKYPFKPQDSLSAVKICAWELANTIESTKKYYSNIDLEKEGLLRTDAGAIKKTKMFTFKNLVHSESDRASSTYQNHIIISLSHEPYTKNGVTYKNIGTYILRQYFEHEEYFRNPYIFNHKVCPGFYFKIIDGLGFHAQVTSMALRTFYDVVLPDTAYKSAITLAATKEVKQVNKVINDKTALDSLIAETQHTYLKTPSGLFTEVTLPISEIKQSHERDSLMATKIVFQRLNNFTIDNRMFSVPATLLMVQKDSLYSFFENNRLNDSKTSYLSAYNSGSNSYVFSNISSLVNNLWTVRNAEMKKDSQWEAKHPNWNKVVLVPVTYTTTSTSTTPTSIRNDMSLSSIRLVGGTTPISVDVIFGKYNQ